MPTVAEYAETWSRALTGHVHPRTAAAYRANLRNHVLPVLGPTRLAALTTTEIRRFLLRLRERGMSRSVLHNVHVALSSCLWFAVQHEHIAINPALGAGRRLFRRVRRGDVLRRARSRPEVRALLETCACMQPRFTVLLMTFLGSGLRIGECLALRPEDLDVERRTLRVQRQWIRGQIDGPKCDQFRTVELPRQLVQILARHIADQRTALWLFPSARRPEQPWRVQYIERMITDLARRAGLPHTTPHMLRHIYATLALEESRDLTFVSRQLGHASTSITSDLYATDAVLRHPQALARLVTSLTPREHGWPRRKSPQRAPWPERKPPRNQARS